MDKKILKKILNTVSVSGNEQIVSLIMADCAKTYGLKAQSDVMGNTYVYIGCDGPKSKVLIEAHCDEIGFQVIHIAESGYIYLRRNGGIDEQCVPGSQFLIQTKNGELIPAVIGKKPIHLMNSDDRKHTIEMHQLWLDTGLETEEVMDKISVGDYVAVSPNARFLGANRITSKALDNKLGVFVLTQVIEATTLVDYIKDICIAATVQEEVGSRGAVTCAHKVKPEIAITIDLDFATDVPNCNPARYGKINLGNGVIIPRNVDCDSELSYQFELLANELGIAHQISARPHATGGTNTSRIQLSRDGIRTISLGIPCRYMHTPVEVCDLRDVQACISLVFEYIKRL